MDGKPGMTEHCSKTCDYKISSIEKGIARELLNRQLFFELKRKRLSAKKAA